MVTEILLDDAPTGLILADTPIALMLADVPVSIFVDLDGETGALGAGGGSPALNLAWETLQGLDGEDLELL